MSATTHRAAVSDTSPDPTESAVSMLTEGFRYPPDTPSHVEVLVASHHLAGVDALDLYCAIRDAGAHPDSTLRVLPKPPKEVLSP